MRKQSEASRLGRGYQPKAANGNEPPEEIEPEPKEPLEDTEIEGESQIIRGNSLPIVDLRNYNTDGKEAHYVRINQIVEAVTEGKKGFNGLSMKRELTFDDDNISVPNELTKKLLDTLHNGDAGTTKMAEPANLFWRPNFTEDIEESV